jgi:protein-S-isoprenylcysteine O-methyltransferase Ste14
MRAARPFAWGGAAIFLLSLAYFLFAYATAFGETAQGDDSAAAITWNVLLFTVFAGHHSVFAREAVRARIARVVPAALERSFYVWIASLLFIAVCALWRPVPGVAWQAGGIVLWTLRLLQIAGVGLTLGSAAILDIRELAGLRRPEGLRLPEFRSSGPYGWVRHPIYSGWFLMVFAASPMTMTRLVFAVVSCAYLVIAIPLEERSMRMASHGAYDRYAAQVRWKLVPGIY